MIRYDVVVICEEPLTNPTSSVLLDNLPIQEFSHFRWRPAFPVSPWVMGIFDALNWRPSPTLLVSLLPATTKQ